MNTLATMININLIISILLALVIFQFVLTPLHRLVSCFIYRNVMVKREAMARASTKTTVDAKQSKERST
ncbi:hypothetical protein MK852_19480 [Shewanella benthica]|nr:hypothetical protein [Shewanella benthica]